MSFKAAANALASLGDQGLPASRQGSVVLAQRSLRSLCMELFIKCLHRLRRRPLIKGHDVVPLY